MERIWSSLRIKLLNRKRCRTSLELAGAIGYYIENFYNPSRRHSSLKYLTPNEFEDLHSPTPTETTLS